MHSSHEAGIVRVFKFEIAEITEIAYLLRRAKQWWNGLVEIGLLPAPQTPPSCPGLSRASTFLRREEDVDGRVEPGHDAVEARRA
ncbi:hypothetical protein UNPF46_02385 [Bradyrhizobium sp. UNPF46]|nr:hypothetical protein UNPF46_02385 [Bradyrhizobium sp. UNPF46]